MVKAFISAVIFCSVCFIGIFINKHKKQRLTFYKEYLKYLLFANESVRTVKESKSEINQKAASLLGTDFNSFLSDSVIPRYIGNEEGKEIRDFFEKFGTTDFQSTLEALSRETVRIEEKLTECEKDIKNKGGMIMKLCILGGIAIVVLIV